MSLNPLSICWVAVFVLIAIGIVMASRHLRAGRMNSPAIRRFDLEAFVAVLDPEDEAYLKSMLSKPAFLRLKRKRIRVALRYLSRLGANMAGILQIRNTEWLLASENAPFDSAASIASDLASHIRILCLIAFAKLSLEFLFPARQFSPVELIGDYRSLKGVLAEMQKIAAESDLAAVPVL
jgi:hypothetical protein